MRHPILPVMLFSALSTAAPASTENSAFPKLCAELDLAVISDIELERVEIELNRMGFPRGAKRDSS